MIDNETFKKIYEQANTVQKYLSSSSKSGEDLFKMARKYSINEAAAYSKFAVTIGDIILGFYKIEDTVPLLQQELELDAKTAALLGADVIDFLAPLSDPNWQPPVEDEILDNDNDSDSVNEAYPVSESSTPINQQPEQPYIPEVRTMASDMQRSSARSEYEPITSIEEETTYVSTQPETRQNLSDTPSYSAPLYQAPKPATDVPLEKPRWGS